MTGVEPHLPERRVPRQDRRVAAARDERIERVAHAPRPVLVVADAEHETRAFEDLRVLLEVLRDRDVDAVAVGLGPAGEGPLVGEPSGPAAPVREAERARPAAEPHRLPVGFGLHHPADRLGLDEEPLRERAFERHARAAGVQRRTAPVVVRVPGRGRQHEQDRRGIGRVGSNDEERVGAFVAGGHGDGVVPRPPRARRGSRARGASRSRSRRRPRACRAIGRRSPPRPRRVRTGRPHGRR